MHTTSTTHTSRGLGDAAGSAARVHEKHASREHSSGMGHSGHFGPLKSMSYVETLEYLITFDLLSVSRSFGTL